LATLSASGCVNDGAAGHAVSAGITHIFVVGIGFDGGVKATAVDAAELGYRTCIVEEGTNASARSKQGRAKTLMELERAGVCIVGFESPVLNAILRT
jgi:nicotinamidase-related amidase